MKDITLKLDGDSKGFTLQVISNNLDYSFISFDLLGNVLEQKSTNLSLDDIVIVGKKVLSFLSEIHDLIQKGDFSFTDRHFEKKNDHISYFFSLNKFDLLIAMQYRCLSYTYLDRCCFVMDDTIIHVNNSLVSLLNNRAVYHLFKKSIYRTALLFDDHFKAPIHLFHDLSAGDKVSLSSVSYEGMTEGIIKNFYISDEFAEMALLDMNGKEFSWFVRNLEKIKD